MVDTFLVFATGKNFKFVRFSWADLSAPWTDGKKYEIDRVADVRQAPSLRGGGLAIRYTVKIRGKEVYLFEDEGRWFVEG